MVALGSLCGQADSTAGDNMLLSSSVQDLLRQPPLPHPDNSDLVKHRLTWIPSYVSPRDENCDAIRPVEDLLEHETPNCSAENDEYVDVLKTDYYTFTWAS
jgi:hypothetical protein